MRIVPLGRMPAANNKKGSGPKKGGKGGAKQGIYYILIVDKFDITL